MAGDLTNSHDTTYVIHFSLAFAHMWERCTPSAKGSLYNQFIVSKGFYSRCMPQVRGVSLSAAHVMIKNCLTVGSLPLEDAQWLPSTWRGSFRAALCVVLFTHLISHISPRNSNLPFKILRSQSAIEHLGA